MRCLCPFHSLCARFRACGGGVGWDGYDDVHLHLHTCLMLRNRMFHVGVGWGGFGMMTFICTCTHVWCYATGCFMWGWGGVGVMTFICTCTHVWCYATGCFMWGWGGVGWVWWRSFALAHMFDATQQDVSCGGGVGWGGNDDVHLHLHTCLMLRNRMFHVGVGWGGYDDVHLHLHTCLMLRLGTYFTHVYNLW